MAVGIASGGTALIALKPRAYFLVLTDQRLYLTDNNNGQVGKEVVSAVSRAQISAGPLHKHFLTLSMEVQMTAPTPWRFSWGRAQSDMARRVATALGAPETPSQAAARSEAALLVALAPNMVASPALPPGTPYQHGLPAP
ncbi:hypothetical protein GCM10010302_16810 [Streptomyces polychromogenes]|uniref:Uncharacterized protein n=1 Tax=Streptomyces polychromogenes TaxID=67342 RepID=A0ABP3EYB4_9ACTN